MTIKDESQIKKIRSKSYSTLRATSPAIEKILYKPIKVLDHGFIRVIDYMGTDQSITQIKPWSRTFIGLYKIFSIAGEVARNVE